MEVPVPSLENSLMRCFNLSKLQKIVKSFKEDYDKTFSCALLVGSSVYLGKLREGGDIDVVIIMRDLSEWRVACKYFCESDPRIFSESLRLFNQGKVHYFSLKPVIEDVPFSIDFIPKAKIDDFTSNFEEWLDKKIYKTSAEKQNKYLIFGCEPDVVKVKKENILCGGLTLVNSPIGVISNNYFYHGILMGKFIGGYDVLWDNIRAEQSVLNFCKVGIQEYFRTNKLNNLQDVLKSLNKYDSWSNGHIERQINKYKGVL